MSLTVTYPIARIVTPTAIRRIRVGSGVSDAKLNSVIFPAA
jgi:hypothetical protein